MVRAIGNRVAAWDHVVLKLIAVPRKAQMFFRAA
jgi:hypothetical protein